MMRFTNHSMIGVAVALALGVGAGCVQLEQTIAIRPDGSGSVRYRYAFAETDLNLLAGGQRVIEKWQGANPGASVLGLNWFLNEAAARRHFSGRGVKLSEFALASADGRRRVDLTVTAENMQKALAAGTFGEFSLARNDDGTLRFAAALVSDADAAAVTPAVEKRLRELCRGLRLVLRVEGPGPIVTSTAHTTAGNAAVWTFDADQDPTFLVRTPAIEAVFKPAPGP